MCQGGKFCPEGVKRRLSGGKEASRGKVNPWGSNSNVVEGRGKCRERQGNGAQGVALLKVEEVSRSETGL